LKKTKEKKNHDSFIFKTKKKFIIEKLIKTLKSPWIFNLNKNQKKNIIQKAKTKTKFKLESSYIMIAVILWFFSVFFLNYICMLQTIKNTIYF
jgi:hypothetical protein